MSRELFTVIPEGKILTHTKYLKTALETHVNVQANQKDSKGTKNKLGWLKSRGRESIKNNVFFKSENNLLIWETVKIGKIK